MFGSPGLRPSNDDTEAIVDNCNSRPRILEKSDQARIDRGWLFQGSSPLRMALYFPPAIQDKEAPLMAMEWSGFWEIAPSSVHGIGDYSLPIRFSRFGFGHFS
jgi:hypothetical protein